MRLSGEQVDLQQVLGSQAPDPEALAEHRELQGAVRAALGRLSATQRAAVVQRYYLGLSGHEMAAEAGCSPRDDHSNRPHREAYLLLALPRAEQSTS